MNTEPKKVQIKPWSSARPVIGVCAVVMGLFQLSGSVKAATITMIAADTGTNSSFTMGSNWSNGAIPTSGNAYVDGSYILRTPADQTSHSFAGDSLTIGNGSSTTASLYYKGISTGTTTVITVSALNLNLATISNGATSPGATWTLAGNIVLQSGGGTLDVGSQGRVTIVSAAISGNGALTASDSTAIGTGTVILKGNNSYSGGTTIKPYTSLVVQSSSALGTGSVTVSGGVLDLGGYSIGNTLGPLTSGTVLNGVITNNGGNYSLQAGAVNATLAGSNGVNKTTSGTVTFSGSNSYTGATTVSAGELDINGSSTGSAFNVTGGAVLGGSGTVSGVVTANGNITGSLTFNNAVTIGNGVTATASAFNGSIINNGAITSGFTVASGQTLSGSGTASGVVTANGNITGSLTFNNAVTIGSGVSAAASAFNGNIVNNGTISSAVNVLSGRTLSGTGSVTNSVTVSGTTSAGNGSNTGVMTLDLTYNSGATANFNVSGTSNGSGLTAKNSGLSYSQVVVSGSAGAVNLQLGSGTTASQRQADGSSNSGVTLKVTLSLSDYSMLVANASNNYIGGGANSSLDNFFVFKLDSGLSAGEFETLTLDVGGTLYSGTIYYSGANDRFDGTSSLGNVSVTVSGTTQEFAISYIGDYSTNSTTGGNDIVLTAIPEPGTWAMVASGIGSLIGIQRLRRRMEA